MIVTQKEQIYYIENAENMIVLAADSLLKQSVMPFQLKTGKLDTIWNLQLGDDTYQVVANAMDSYIRSQAVTDIYVSQLKKIGTEYNIEQFEDGTLKRWEHFQIVLPDKLVDKSGRSVGDIKGTFRDTKNVFKRSLDEISNDALDTILELINSNTLYKGEEWKNVLTSFRKYKKEYEKLEWPRRMMRL